MYRWITHLVLVMCCLLAVNHSTAATVEGRVLVLGDSITHAGTWVSMLAYKLAKHDGQLSDIVSIGLSSETASGLSEPNHPFPRPCVHERLQRALAAVKPAVVIACYGMNDGIYEPSSPAQQQAFQTGMERLVKECQAIGATVILLTPPPFEPEKVKKTADKPPFGYRHPYRDYDDVLGEFAAWEIKRWSADTAVRVIDLHAGVSTALQAEREKNPAFRLTGDGIHPQALGHLMMARSVLPGLGVPVAQDVHADLAATQADPLYKSIAKWRGDRSKGWLAYVGYTRGKTVKTDSIDSVESVAAEQMKDINSQLRQ